MKGHTKWFRFCAVVCALFCCLSPSALGKDAGSFPERFDLRELGVVTPVKNQAPFGTCWAFGAIASIETSMLSAMHTTYDETGLDLSERQLGWFAYTPLPNAETMAGIDALAPYVSQAGEGQAPVVGRENYYGTPFGVGGWSFLVTTLISSGIGPVRESRIPYKNNENVAISNLDEPSVVVADGQSVFDLPGGPDHYNLFERTSEFGDESVHNCRVVTDELIERNALSSYAAYPAYSPDGTLNFPSIAQKGGSMYDWSLPEGDRLLSSVQLKETYILPTPASYDERGNYRFNADGVRAIKEQLMEGRAVCVCFAADVFLSDEEGLTSYMNKATWSHYTYDPDNRGEAQHANHVVSIVGWDDTWGPEKFIQGKTESGASMAPPAAGAWIVKNSWGQRAMGFPMRAPSASWTMRANTAATSISPTTT